MDDTSINPNDVSWDNSAPIASNNNAQLSAEIHPSEVEWDNNVSNQAPNVLTKPIAAQSKGPRQTDEYYKLGIPLGEDPTPIDWTNAAGVASDVALQGGGALAGQQIGTYAGGILGALGGPETIPLGALVGGGIGGMIGGALGNTGSQFRQMAAGERKKFSAPDVAQAGIMSAVPAGSLENATVTDLLKEASKQGAANLAGLAAKSLGEKGNFSEFTPEQLTTLFLTTGLGIGGAKLLDLGADAAKAAEQLANENATLSALKVAQDAGYKILPSTLNKSGIINNAIEHLAGKPETMAELVKRNAAVTNALVRKELGLPFDQVINLNALNGVRETANQVYEQTRNVSPYASELIDTFKEADRQAKAHFNANAKGSDPTLYDKAVAFRKQSNQAWDDLSTELKNNGHDDLLGQLKQARTTIAKVHAIEDAFDTGSGTIAGDILAARSSKGKSIPTGDLKVIADFASNFPRAAGSSIERSTGNVFTKNTVPGASAALGYYLGGPVAGLAAGVAGSGARVLARKTIATDLYQKLFASPVNETLQMDKPAIAAYMGSMVGGANAANPNINYSDYVYPNQHSQ
jgi:hypothetical protein